MQKTRMPVQCAIHAQLATGKVIEGVGWCEECEYRRDLWTWGAQHRFPEVRTGIYAMGKGRGTWLFQTAFASDERIADLLCSVMARDEDERKEGIA